MAVELEEDFMGGVATIGWHLWTVDLLLLISGSVLVSLVYEENPIFGF